MTIQDQYKTHDCRERVFIIAELSANHNQDFDVAVKTIEAAARAGADAIKLQTYTADTITIDSDKDYFKVAKGTLWEGRTLYDLYQEAYTPWDWQPKLIKTAQELGLVCFSSPFDPTAVDFLEEMDVPAYKIASFEITDIPLIEYVASKGKPVIISTGVATQAEIEEAVAACRNQGNEQIALLQCSSSYPAPPSEINLRRIPDMAERFGVLAGLSDHTLGSTVAIAAVALGACIVEKHFILDRAMGGPDAAFSMQPAEFKAMTEGIRTTEEALGTTTYELSEKAKKNRQGIRSLFVVKDIRKGEVFSVENIRSIRPGHGLPPKMLPGIIGRKATKDIEKGEPLDEGMIGA